MTQPFSQRECTTKSYFGFHFAVCLANAFHILKPPQGPWKASQYETDFATIFAIVGVTGAIYC